MSDNVIKLRPDTSGGAHLTCECGEAWISLPVAVNAVTGKIEATAITGECMSCHVPIELPVVRDA